MKEYALYKGDNLLGIGTRKELAKQLGVKESTISFYGTPRNARLNKGNKRTLVCLDEECE